MIANQNKLAVQEGHLRSISPIFFAKFGKKFAIQFHQRLGDGNSQSKFAKRHSPKKVSNFAR
jgi:hypothetical protein